MSGGYVVRMRLMTTAAIEKDDEVKDLNKLLKSDVRSCQVAIVAGVTVQIDGECARHLCGFVLWH